MKHLSLLLFTLPLIAVSCKPDSPTAHKKTCTDYGTCETAISAKEFFVFKTGSWWVYEEESSHERDSLYVTESVDTESADFSVWVYSQREDMRYHYFPLIVEASPCQSQTTIHRDTKCLYVRRSKGNFGNYIGEDICFFIQYWKGQNAKVTNIDFPHDKITVSDVYQEYQLSGFVFPTTVKIHENNTFIENNEETNHYFSKGIGLVRKELLGSNQVWNLVSYYIAP